MAHREKNIRKSSLDWLDLEEEAVQPVHSRSRRVVGAFVKVKQPEARKTRVNYAAAGATSADVAVAHQPAKSPPALQSTFAPIAQVRHRRKKGSSQLRAPYKR